jgi:hypothetical protein
VTVQRALRGSPGGRFGSVVPDLLALEAVVGEDIYVEGLPEGARAGDAFEIAWTWLAEADIDRDLFARLVWEGQGTRGTSGARPLTPGYPTSQWLARDNWRGHATFTVPGHLDDGRYVVSVEVVDGDGEALGSLATGAMQVAAPERTYSAPDWAAGTLATWADGIRLCGMQVGADVVRLCWTTDQPLATSLRLFVHLLDGERIAEQWDGVPADWMRPTTGWVPGEYIVTEHPFAALNEVAKSLRIGFYDPATGARMPLTDETDAFDRALP